MKKIRASLILIALLWINYMPLLAQPVLQNDYSYSLKIPSVVAMESSAAHLYVLSASEGMAVFRTRPDSLQWLYTASGMQQRGDIIHADIRFAYLFGDSNRLTVLEPTSVMGAYSATTLPHKPLDAVRFDENLYVALGNSGLGKLNLKSPKSLDTPVQKIDAKSIQSQNVIDLAASPNKLFALTDNHQLFFFNKNERNVSYEKSVSLKKNISRLFFVKNSLMGSNDAGDIFEISGSATLAQLGSIGESVVNLKSWNNWLIIKGESGRLWSSYQRTEPTLWKKNGNAGNFMAISKGQFWLCEYNRISRIQAVSGQESADQSASDNASQSSLQIKAIANQVIPYPHALLIPLKLKGDFPVGQVQFDVQSDVQDAKVRGQSLYWKPKSSDKGNHQFKIVASTSDGQSSSTSFTVDVQSFNSPPRFIPLRTISIPVGRPFNLPVRALDPDGMNKKLIRYLGVNLPKGASIDEQTGKFEWKPTRRQIGKNSFRVIATDQYGAASSADVTIRVIETSGGEE